MVSAPMKLPAENLRQTDASRNFDLEWRACRKSCLYFLKKYAKIKDEQFGIIPWEDWPYLTAFIDDLSVYRQIWLLKARQLSATTTVALYVLWQALFREGATIYLMSKGEREAMKFLEKCRTAWEYLPDFLKLKLGKDGESQLTFPTLHSSIDSLPATENPLRMTGATLVVWDEAEYHKSAEMAYGAIKPTLTAGGQFIAMSTADRTQLNTLFKEKYQAAKHSSTGEAKAIFWPWHVRPDRDAEWFKRETDDMAPWQVEGEFPNTEEEALSTLKTRMFFDRDALLQMRESTLPLVDCELSRKYTGIVKIFKLPYPGTKYCVFTDPSQGKEDPHGTIVMEAKSGEQVAESHGMLPVDQCARVHDDLVRFYNKAFNSYEIIGEAGGLFAAKMEELATPNRCGFLRPDMTIDTTSGRKGWWSGKKIWDTTIWGLEEAVRLRQIRLHSKEAIDEFMSFIVPEGDKPQKQRGMHDDLIDAWRGVWQLRKYASFGVAHATSFKYRESN